MFQLIKSLNYWKERKGYRPEAIVIHITDGNRKSVINWFLTPASQVSSHYLICKDGDIIKFVEEKDTAWHCGLIKNPKWDLLKLKTSPTASVSLFSQPPSQFKPSVIVNPNRYTIGLEFEGFNHEQLTFQQLVIGAWLLFKISASWGIALDSEHVIPHNWVNGSKACPGLRVNLSYLIRLAKILKNN